MKNYFYPLSTHVEAKSKSYAKAFAITVIVSAIISGCVYSINRARAFQSGQVHGVHTQSTNTARKEALVTPCKEVKPGAFDCTDETTKETIYNLGKGQVKWADQKPVKGKTIKATVTGYTSRAQETDSTPEIAANGKNIWKLYQQGINTCASNDYKLGTVLTIEGLGTCTVFDRMNSRFTGTGRIDWYFGYDLKAALKHGVKTHNVII